MNDRLPHDHDPPPIDDEPPPTEKEKMALAGRAMGFVPYEEGMTPDQFGSYVKHFRLQEGLGFVSIYIPSLTSPREPGQIVSDSIWIVKRVPEDLGNGIGLTHITNYMIDEVDLSAIKITDMRVFDVATGKEIKPEMTAEERVRAGIEEFETQSSYLTHADLNEVNNLLDSLDPDDIFELPDPSNE